MCKQQKITRCLSVLLATALVFTAFMLYSGRVEWMMRMMGAALPSFDTVPLLRVHPSPAMTDTEGRRLYAFLNQNEQWSFPVPADQISPYMTQATLAVEDKRFFRHAGVDSRAVLRAAWMNLKAGHVASGASTLTMQVVKAQTPLPRTLRGKLLQAWRAWRLETNTDKRSILETYLNIAPYGGNLVGVEAAAQRYFGKSAAELTLHEAATLAGLPKSPTALNPLRFPKRAQQRRNHVLRRMYKESMISADILAAAAARPLGVQWHDYPALAPHLAMRYRATLYKNGGVQLTLDADLQRHLEDQVQRHLRQFDNEITNTALMVLDVKKGSVLARIGSADFFNPDIKGQVDVCRASRAPGSALKPFIYALALDQQQLYPTEALLDNPLDYGIYNPANFDGAFNGVVSAGEALRWSLNIPAVQITERVGVEAVAAFLDRLGLESLHRPPEEYGLGVALGNYETSLEALVTAYLAIAQLGLYQPPRLRFHEQRSQARRVLPEGVALSLWQMLEQPFPNEPWTNLVRIGDRSTRLCWKTGTSTGYHDAWAVAFNQHYVVGAWLGNNDARPSPRLIGAQAALPLVARVFRSLPVPPEPAWPSAHTRLHEVEICALTGLPKGLWCPTVTTARFSVEQYLHRRCDVHRPDASGRVVAYWPMATRKWDLAQVPTTGEGTAPISAGTSEDRTGIIRRRALDIISPAQNATYVLTGESGQDRIQLTTNNDWDTLHWYHNDRYLGSSQRMQPLFLPLAAGDHHVSCMNDAGQTASTSFYVEAD